MFVGYVYVVGSVGDTGGGCGGGGCESLTATTPLGWSREQRIEPLMGDPGLGRAHSPAHHSTALQIFPSDRQAFIFLDNPIDFSCTACWDMHSTDLSREGSRQTLGYFLFLVKLPSPSPSILQT